MELKRVAQEDFIRLLHQSFVVGLEGEPLQLELIEVKGLSSEIGGEQRPAFSILFRGPAEPALTQSIYPVDHPDLGELHIFLVPLGPARSGGDGVLYEAVFS